MFAHIDADSFFAAVLQRKYPKLRKKPLIAAGMGGGCVIAATYDAKAKGVKTGMRLKEAKKLCPEAVVHPADFGETLIASRAIEAIIEDHCPVVEQMSIDEWYLDLRAIPGGEPFDLQLWGREIQQEILRKTALSVSVGIAHTKLLAKMAGEEHKPAGVTVIEKHQIEDFLLRRPATAIPGIGRKREVHAKARNWQTAWDIAAAEDDVLRKLFGRPGIELKRELLGERVWSISTESEPPKSISRCRSFRGTDDLDTMWAYALQHLSICVYRLRKHKLAARHITLWMRNAHYRHDGLALRLPQPLNTEQSLQPFLQTCFDRLRLQVGTCTQIGVRLGELCTAGEPQFSLFEPPQRIIDNQRLQQSMDRLRKRFGRDVIMHGSSLPVWKRRGQMPFLSVAGEETGNPFLS